jgi:Xaa-Pro dipeptidase
MIAPIANEERCERARLAFDFVPAATDALVLFDDQFVQYYSGFIFFPTERPIALIIMREGERTLFVPRLEREHALVTCDVEHVLDYPEYPGERHPMQLLIDHVSRQGIKHLGVDHDGYPPVMGYRPYPLSPHLPVTLISSALDQQMAIKSEHELRLIRESIRWGHHAHELLQQYTQPGLRENDVVARACKEATSAMTEALGPDYRQRNKWISGALAIYRGQIGRNSALPHALATNATFQTGDTLVTGAGADVWGYLSELERTMFIGDVSPEQRRFFQHMLNLQEVAFEQIRPGLLCADVDRAVRTYYEKENLTEHWRHHVGHSLGQRIHESPFLDIGDSTILQPGMVLSVEPGLYIPGLGGFRHSDTVLVTADGLEILTTYPRDLDRLIIPVAA